MYTLRCMESFVRRNTKGSHRAKWVYLIQQPVKIFLIRCIILCIPMVANLLCPTRSNLNFLHTAYPYTERRSSLFTESYSMVDSNRLELYPYEIVSQPSTGWQMPNM